MEEEVEAERERLAVERKKREDEQFAEKEKTGPSTPVDQGMTGHGMDDFGQPDYSAVDYGLDDLQPNAMNNDDQVMSPRRRASLISGWNADAQPQDSTTLSGGEQMAGAMQ